MLIEKKVMPILNTFRSICWCGVLVSMFFFLVQTANADNSINANTPQAAANNKQIATSRIVALSDTHTALLNIEEATWLAQHTTVTVGATKYWPPFDFVDVNNQYSGYVYDYLELISKKTGLNFDYKVNTWSHNIDALKNGTIDVVGGIKYLEKRTSFLNYSPAFLSLSNYFFIHKDLKITTLEELNGKTVAIPTGFANIDTFKTSFPNIAILETQTLNDAIDAVLERKADILFDYYAVLNYSLRKEGITDIVPFKSARNLGSENLHIASKKDEPLLNSIITKGMNAISLKEKQQIEAKWFGSGLQRAQSKLTTTEVDWIKSHPNLRFASDSGLMPFSGYANGSYKGIISDLMQGFEKNLGLSFNDVQTDSRKQTYELAKAKNIDLFTKPLANKNTNEFIYSKAIVSSPIVIVTKDNNQYLENLSSIENKSIGLVPEYTNLAKLKALYPRHNFVSVPNNKQGLEGVSTGKYDYFLCSLTSASYLINNLGLNQLRVVGQTEQVMEIGFAVADKQNKPLIGIINKAIADQDPKTKSDILTKWSEQKPTIITDYSLLMKVVIGFSSLLFLSWLWYRKTITESREKVKNAKHLAMLNKRFQLATTAGGLGVWEIEFDPEKSDKDFKPFSAKYIHYTDVEKKLLTQIYRFGNVSHISADENTLNQYDIKSKDKISWHGLLARVSEKDRLLFLNILLNTLKGEGDGKFTFSLNGLHSKKTIFIHSSMTLESLDKGSRIVGVNLDITNLKQTEKELKKAKMEADKANHAKSAFIANISHEIRTPMNSILGFTELLHEQIEDKKHKSYLNTVQTAGRSLLSLINDVLDLSKIESGKFDIQKSPSNLQSFLSDIATIFSIKVEEKGLDFEIIVDENIPSSVNIDKARVRQILFNLIGNAVKFTEQGSIVLSVKAVNVNEIRSTVDLLFSVEDTGIGIPEGQLLKIFKPFEQVAGQDVQKYGGTGLGLPICKRLANMMGGELSVHNNTTKGATFILLLKNVDVASIHTENEPLSKNINREFLEDTILVVDDVKENRELMIQSFSNTKITVESARHGKEAIEMCAQKNYSLVFMDIRMPVMDGYAATKKIKENNDTMPVVALTASVMSDEFQRIQNSKFDGYLRKPVLRKDLLDTVAKFIDFEEIEADEQSNTNTANTINSSASMHSQPSNQRQLNLNTVVVNTKEKENIQPVLDKLLPMVPTAQQLSETNNINAIADFADELTTCVKELPIEAVTYFISTLKDDLDAFNIAGIKKALQQFPVLLQLLAEQKNN